MNMNQQKRVSPSICGLAALSSALLLTACGGESAAIPSPTITLPPTQVSPPTPSPTPPPAPIPTPTPPPMQSSVIGASSVSACEQAGQNDQSACYIIEGNQANMYGVIGDSSFQDYQQLRREHPNVTEIVLIDVPGSENDDENTRVGLALHNDKLNTRLLANSEIASGGVDYFLAGVHRTIVGGARIGVHSWADSSGTIPANLPRSDPAHRLFLDYYKAIEYPQGEDFYFFTLQAATASDVHWMTDAEISRYEMAN